MRTVNLCLHSGAQTVVRERVAAVPTPPRTPSWVPIPHHRLLAGVQSALERAGLSVVSEAHGLTRDGGRYFGLLQVANGENPEDFGLVVGLRNSHDKSFPAGLVVGATVFVCDNLSFSGEVRLARKHTAHVERDLPALIDLARRRPPCPRCPARPPATVSTATTATAMPSPRRARPTVGAAAGRRALPPRRDIHQAGPAIPGRLPFVQSEDAMTAFDARARALLAEGFVPGAPSAEAVEIDAETCSDATCPGCGHLGLLYNPFFRPARRGVASSYFALATCPACGAVEEF